MYRPHPQIPLKNTQTIHAVCSVWDKGYRYGFNSMEKDNEINVNGGSYDFGARIYDSRLGRWLSLDPLMVKYPGLNPYCGMGNNPILYIDIDGKDIKPGKGWDKSIYSEIFNLLSQQNNPIIVNINEYFAGDKPLNITLAYHGNSQGFDLKKHAKFNEKYNDVNGWCGFLSKSPISVSLIMNSNYRPINTVLKTTNNVTDEMNKQYGTGHYCKISQNNIGKTTALIHELVHASMHAQGVDVNSQHGTMARKGTSAANLIYRSLSAANDANNWGLKKDQLLDISYMGLSQTKGFQDYISEKAGIINPNWQDDIKSNDPKKQEEYTKNIELYKNAYKNWKKSVEDITTDKTYYNKDGDVVDYKNIDKKD